MTTILDKVMRIGCGPNGSVFVRAKFKDGRLSLTGVEGPQKNGNCKGSCGQIDMSSWDIKEYAPGWTPALEKELRAIWHQWHLNDMRAGCEHQRALGWVKYDEHPSEPCPVCGYKFGSAWLFEPVPEQVLTRLESFPSTDLTPHWI